MCQDSIKVNHNNKDSMGETIIRIRIKAKGGVIIRIITVRTIKGMDGGTIRTICHQTELVNHLLRKRWT